MVQQGAATGGWGVDPMSSDLFQLLQTGSNEQG